MRCPRDNYLLSRKMSERLIGNGCNQCNGLFLMGKKTEDYQHNIEKQLLENTVQQDPLYNSNLLCPDCNTHMNVTFVDNIEIDICHKCFGIWFDKTEAQALIQKYNKDLNTDNNSNFAPFPYEFVSLLSKWFLPKPQV